LKSWLRPTPPKLLVLLVAALFLAKLGWPGNVFYPPGSEFSDLMLTHWPNAYFFKQSVWQDHSWPLWNPNQFAGVPFAANPLSGLWYPPNLLFLLLPITPAFNVLLLLHLSLGGMGMMHLLQRLLEGRCSEQTAVAAGLLAGLAWALTPKIWAHMGAGHVGLVYAAAWLPWVAGAALDLTRAPFPFAHYQLAFLWALQFLADPRLAAYTAGALTCSALWWVWDKKSAELPRPIREPVWRWRGLRVNLPRWRGHRLRFLGPWLLAGLLGLAMTAVQWLPLLDYLPHTGRSELTVGQSAVQSLPWSRLLGLLWTRPGAYHEWITYVGITVFFLGVIGCLTLPGRTRWGVTLGLLALVLFAVGDNGPLYPLLARLPGATLLRAPPRVWFLVSFVMVMLAGLGVADLAAGGRVLARHRRALTRLAVGVLGLTGMLLIGIWFVPEGRPLAGTMAASFFWSLAAVAAVLVPQRGRWPAWATGSLLVLVVAAELIWMDASLVVRRPADELFTDGWETALYLRSDTWGRIYAPSFRPSPPVAATVGIRIANGVDPLQPADYADLVHRAAGIVEQQDYSVTLPALPEPKGDRNDWQVATALQDASPEPWLLAALNVDMVVSQYPLRSIWLEELFQYEREELYIYRNRAAVRWPAVALSHLDSGELASKAIVLDGVDLQGPAGHTSAQQLFINPNQVRVQVQGPGLLVVNELYLPGWRAWVDDQPVEIVVANGVMRGIYLAKGQHTVEMIYQPWSVSAGAVLSTLALLPSGVGSWVGPWPFCCLAVCLICWAGPRRPAAR